jgi:hypothetical protein
MQVGLARWVQGRGTPLASRKTLKKKGDRRSRPSRFFEILRDCEMAVMRLRDGHGTMRKLAKSADSDADMLDVAAVRSTGTSYKQPACHSTLPAS